jgi:hypothetical protein
MNRLPDLELFLIQCIKALRDAFDTANSFERARAFWPMIIGGFLLYAINGFDGVGLCSVLSILFPYFLIAAAGWGKETKESADNVIKLIVVGPPIKPTTLPALLIKPVSRTIPVPLSPPRFSSSSTF